MIFFPAGFFANQKGYTLKKYEREESENQWKPEFKLLVCYWFEQRRRQGSTKSSLSLLLPSGVGIPNIPFYRHYYPRVVPLLFPYFLCRKIKWLYGTFLVCLK